MMEKQFDYSLASMRFFLDYRLKIFSFSVAFSGAGATIMFSNLVLDGARVVISAFLCLIVLAFFACERVAVFHTHQYRDAALATSEEAGYEKISEILGGNRGNIISLNRIFAVIYCAKSILFFGSFLFFV